jgi:hypothetical protein
MKITVEWSEAEKVATIFHDNVLIATPEDVDEWKRQLYPQLEAITLRLGKKPLVLVCIDGISIEPAVSVEYGKGAKYIGEVLSARLARYGNPAVVRAIIAKEAIKQGYKANLFETRDEARRYLAARA